MMIKAIPAGQIEANCYFVYDEQTLEAAVIDPGDQGELLLRGAQSLGLEVRYILLTHGHYDHVGAVGAFRAAFPRAQVYIHPADAADVPSHWRMARFDGLYGYQGGEALPFCGGVIQVLHTPGHSEGSVCLRIDHGHEVLLFSGDTLFAGSCGRTDFPGGDYGEMMRSLARLSQLPGHTKVYPGHHESTNILREKTRNSFMKEALL